MKRRYVGLLAAPMLMAPLLTPDGALRPRRETLMRRYMRVYSVLGCATALVMSVALLAPTPVEANAPHAKHEDQLIVNSLNADRDLTFSVLGAGGPSVSTTQHVGPRFTLDGPTRIREIGALVNNCGTIVEGVPDCPDAQPFVVEIRPATAEGVPDPSIVISTYRLSHDDDPLVISYESVKLNLRLEAGTYFALLAPQRVEDVGVVLAGAIEYTAGIVDVGFVDPGVSSSMSSGFPAAFRIVARSNR